MTKIGMFVEKPKQNTMEGKEETTEGGEYAKKTIAIG